MALSGLAICEDPGYIAAAKESFRAARAINADAGVVGGVLRLFDVLAETDTEGVLGEVRAAAAGEKRSSED